MWADPDADYDKIGKQQAALEDKIAAADAWSLERNVEIAMDALRCPPDDADVTKLSGGEKRRVALCRLLLSRPDLLLLDEPTNHLDAESVAWLERFLEDYAGTVVAITHDRYFLDNVAQWILELDNGKGIPFEGNYSSWLEQKQERLRDEERGQRGPQAIPGARTRVGADVTEGPPVQGQGPPRRLREALQRDQGGRPGRPRSSRSAIPAGPSSRRSLVIEVEHLSKGFGDRLLIEDLSFSLPPAGIVGIIGPNGAGKSTLFKMLAGREEPDSGSIKIGDTVDLSYVDQDRDDLDPDATVYEEITGGAEVLEGRRPRDPRPGLRVELQLQGHRPAEVGRQALRRRAQPRPSGQAAQVRRQRAAARRADQRPRRRHAAGARGGARVVPRLRRRHQPRPLVPRPHRHPRARVRGRQPGALVRGQLLRVRGAPQEGTRRRRRPAPPHQGALSAAESASDASLCEAIEDSHWPIDGHVSLTGGRGLQRSNRTDKESRAPHE